MKTAKQTFSENSLILVISTILVKIIGALFKIPLASNIFLGDLGFGYYSVAHDIFMPFYILALSGLPSAVSHITAEYVAKNDSKATFWIFKKSKKLFVTLGFLFSCATVILSIPLVLSQNTPKNVLYSIFAILPSIFLMFVISAYRGYFEGHNNMYPTAISKIIEALFKLVLGLILSYAVIKLTNNPALASAAALLAMSFGTLVATLFLSIKFRRAKLEPKYDNHEIDFGLKHIIALSVPYVLASLSASIISLIDLLTVKTYIANASDVYRSYINIVSNDLSTHLYGLRSKAFTLFYLIPTITMSLGISSVPVLSNARANNDNNSICSNVNFSLKLISFITLPSAIGLSVLSKQIMELLYSSNDFYSAKLLLLYGVTALFAGIAIPLTSIVQASGSQNRVVFTVVIGIIIKTAVNLLTVINPNINILAAPIGSIVCYLYITVDLLLVLKRTIKIKFLSCFAKPLISALLCGVSAYVVTLISTQKIFTILAIFIAVLVYLIMIFLTKTFSKEELCNIPLLNKVIK